MELRGEVYCILSWDGIIDVELLKYVSSGFCIVCFVPRLLELHEFVVLQVLRYYKILLYYYIILYHNNI